MCADIHGSQRMDFTSITTEIYYIGAGFLYYSENALYFFC